MAYLDPRRLTCPNCGLAGEVTWIVGLGPHRKPGDAPAYVKLRQAGPFHSKIADGKTDVFCPQDGTVLSRR